MTEVVHRGSFWRRFAGLFALGLVGIIGVLPIIAGSVRRVMEANPESGISFGVLLLLSTLNPILLLAISVAIGVRLAPRAGLTSYVDDRLALGVPVGARLRRDLPLAVALGAGGGALLIVLDAAFEPWMGTAFRDFATTAPVNLTTTASGMLYGGIAEELMMRWGLMTLLVWVGWRIVLRGRGGPTGSIMWGAIVGAAIAFGVGHLPAIAAAVPLTTPIIVRTVALNAIGGFIFGWLFWRRSLEASMVAHATFHVVFAAAALTR